MDRCDQYRTRMLDYVYDALDEPERLALDDHLRQCATCPVELRAAQTQQALLARAAKTTFPHVRFKPPQTPHTLPFPSRTFAAKKQGSRVLPWSAAAGIAIAAGLLTIYLSRPGQKPLDPTPTTIAQDKSDDSQRIMTPLIGQAKPQTGPTGPTQWGTETSGLISSLWADKTKFKVGEKIAIHYEIRNVSHEPVVIWSRPFEGNHIIHVFDKDGKEVALTEKGDVARKSFSPQGGKGRNNPDTLAAGDLRGNLRTPEDLNLYFVLDKAGTYSVQIIRQDDQATGWKGKLESNQLVIEIVP